MSEIIQGMNRAKILELNYCSDKRNGRKFEENEIFASFISNRSFHSVCENQSHLDLFNKYNLNFKYLKTYKGDRKILLIIQSKKLHNS